jgi:hypothetical protein
MVLQVCALFVLQLFTEMAVIRLCCIGATEYHQPLFDSLRAQENVACFVNRYDSATPTCIMKPYCGLMRGGL